MKNQSAVVLSILFLTSCDFVPEKVTMDDPQIQPLLKAATAFDRASLGFTPLPKTAEVRFESRSTDRYDAMLHIYAKTSRTIAFRKTCDGYKWIGEQEIFQGPKKYTGVDGTSYEQITLTYEVAPISGAPLNELFIQYSGEDPRLNNRPILTQQLAQSILKEWNY